MSNGVKLVCRAFGMYSHYSEPDYYIVADKLGRYNPNVNYDYPKHRENPNGYDLLTDIENANILSIQQVEQFTHVIFVVDDIAYMGFTTDREPVKSESFKHQYIFEVCKKYKTDSLTPDGLAGLCEVLKQLDSKVQRGGIYDYIGVWEKLQYHKGTKRNQPDKDGFVSISGVNERIPLVKYNFKRGIVLLPALDDVFSVELHEDDRNYIGKRNGDSYRIYTIPADEWFDNQY